MNGISISPEILIADLFKRWPQTISVFNERRMSCVGCSMAVFDTLEEAAANYGLSVGPLISELQSVIQGGYAKGSTQA